MVYHRILKSSLCHPAQPYCLCFTYGSLRVPSSQPSSPGPPRASELISHVTAQNVSAGTPPQRIGPTHLCWDPSPRESTQHISARTPASESMPSTSLQGPSLRVGPAHLCRDPKLKGMAHHVSAGTPASELASRVMAHRISARTPPQTVV